MPYQIRHAGKVLRACFAVGVFLETAIPVIARVDLLTALATKYSPISTVLIVQSLAQAFGCVISSFGFRYASVRSR